jgi:hypothetical protein
MEKALQKAGQLGRDAANKYMMKLDYIAMEYALSANDSLEDEDDAIDSPEYYAAMEKMAEAFQRAFEQNWAWVQPGE